MLKILRKRKIAKKILYLLAAVIIPAFVLWGSASLIREQQEKKIAGKVFGKKVDYKQYLLALENWRNRLKMQFADQAHHIEKMLDVNQAVWDSIILAHEANRRKIKISDKELVDYIASLPFLQKDGVFDNELYDLFLRYSLNTTPRNFEKQVKQWLTLTALFEEISAGITASEEEILERYKEKNEELKLSYIAVLSQEQEKDTAISESQIDEYYQQHKEEFSRPIQANLILIGKDYPKDSTAQQKEEINASIKGFRNAIEENRNLEELLKEFELEPDETGFFSFGDPIPRFGWLPESTELFFGLEKGSYSDVVLTARGPYVFQMKEKRENYTPSLEELKDEIKAKLVAAQSMELAEQKIRKIEEGIKSKQSENPEIGLKKISEMLNIPIKETEFFTRDSYVPGIGMAGEFSETAFSLKENQISDVTELPHGFFIFGLAQLKEIGQEKFNQEKQEFEEFIITNKKSAFFEEFLEELRMKAGLVDNIGALQR